MTVVIIAGAAILCRKIKNMPSDSRPEDYKVTDVEWQSQSKSMSREISGESTYKTNSCITHHYDSPVHLQQNLLRDLCSPRNGSSLYSHKTDTQYVKLKPVYLPPCDTLKIP